MDGSSDGVWPFGEAPNGSRWKIHPNAADAFGLESQTPAGDGTGGTVSKLNDLSFSAQGTDHGAEDLQLIGLPQVAERKAGNDSVYGPDTRTRKDVRRMRCLATTNSNSGKMCLQELGKHRIALNDEQPFWTETPAKEGSRDSPRPRTDFEHRRLRGIYS
jgi:hypothetical protein